MRLLPWYHQNSDLSTLKKVSELLWLHLLSELPGCRPSTSQSTRQVVDTSKVMMKAANTLFYPDLYDTSSANQRSLHQITNNLIKLMMDRPGELDGFGDPTTTKSARGMLKSLAKVLHGCLPTTTTMKPHCFLSMQHPKSV